MRLTFFVGLFALFQVSTLAESRPWCGSSKLNPTELTICGSAKLRALDSELTSVYGVAKARSYDAGQLYWLRKQRDACGTNRFCIEREYERRIAILGERTGKIIVRNSRPWCSAQRLNRTEQTICDTSRLRDLDAALQLVYGQARARNEDTGQLLWLRKERDQCGSQVGCIQARYEERISVLRNRLNPYRSAATSRRNSCTRSQLNELKAVCVISAVGERACASTLADRVGSGALGAAGASGACGAAASGLIDGSIDPTALGFSVASGFLDGVGDSLLESDDPFSAFAGVIFKAGSLAVTVGGVSSCFERAEASCR